MQYTYAHSTGIAERMSEAVFNGEFFGTKKGLYQNDTALSIKAYFLSNFQHADFTQIKFALGIF